MSETKGEAAETTRERKKRRARIVVLLFFGIPALYGVIMGVVEIVRYILAGLR